jgi:hypothetical protein
MKRTNRVWCGLAGLLAGSVLDFYGGAWGKYGFIQWSEPGTDTSYRFDILYCGVAGAVIGAVFGALLAVKLIRKMQATRVGKDTT